MKKETLLLCVRKSLYGAKSTDDLSGTNLAHIIYLYRSRHPGKQVPKDDGQVYARHPNPKHLGGRISRNTSHTPPKKASAARQMSDLQRDGNEPRSAAEKVIRAVQSPVRWMQKQRGASDRCMARNTTRVTR